MKKHLIALASLLILASTATAQEQEKQTTLKCVYLEQSVNRADQPEKVKQDEFVLAINGNRSAFYSQYSRALTTAKDSLLRLGMSAMEILAVVRDMPKGKSIEIYKNQPDNGKYLQYEKLAQDFRFEDSLPQISWQTSDETKDILGYVCQKATCELYGRKWTVWFTMDIPAFDGPWLLTGLPGLILEASDADNLFHFTAVELSNDNSLSTEPAERKYIKCTREELMKQRRKMDEDLIGTLQATMGMKIKAVMDAQGNPIKQKERKTNYYEKE